MPFFNKTNQFVFVSFKFEVLVVLPNMTLIR